MKKLLLNKNLFKATLLATGLLFTGGLLAQTTINNGETRDASTIGAGTNITINAGGRLNMDIARSYGNITTSGTGTSTISGTPTLTVSNTLTVGANNELAIAPDFSATNFICGNGSTVKYGGASQIIRDANYFNLTIAGTGTKTLGGGNRALTGNLLIESGASLSLGNNDLTINENSARTATINGTLNLNGSGRFLKLSANNKTLILGSNAILTLSGIFGGDGQQLPVFNTYTFSATSTVQYSASGDQSITDVQSPGYGHLIISGGSNGDVKQPNGALDIQGNLTISSGTFAAASFTHSLKGNWKKDGGAVTSVRINFNGSVTQTIGGSQSTSFERITFSNTGDGITLLRPATITDNAVFDNGIVTSDATNLLIFADEASSSLSATNATTTSYVNGPVRKIGNNNFTFPVGKSGTGFVPIRIEGLSGNGSTFTAEYVRTTPPNRTSITASGIQRISKCEYWTLNREAGTTTTPDVIGYWNANSPCDAGPYVTEPSSMRLVHYNGTSWDLASIPAGQGNVTNGSVTWTNVDAFSPFALGTTNAAANPLPVVFANVKAYEKNSGVQIEWSNLTEKDVAAYTVERSSNGKDFSSIGEQAATSNQNDKADYTSFDAAPASGVSYYRIKALETTGKIVYSKILSISLGKSVIGLKLYPNPVIDNQATISLANLKHGQYNLQIANTSGVNVYTRVIRAQSSNLTQTVDLPSTIKPGVYTIVITGESYKESKVFIIQ